jgi:hypothetical protein
MLYHNVKKHYETFFLMLTWFKLKNTHLGKQLNVMGHHSIFLFFLRKGEEISEIMFKLNKINVSTMRYEPRVKYTFNV